jgi:succinoglycan biosynthesis transport protein ExoP
MQMKSHELASRPPSESGAPEHLTGHEPPPERSENRLGEFFGVIRNHLSVILVLFLMPLLLCTIIVFNMTPIYMARSTIQIYDTKPKPLDSQEVTTQERSGNEGHDFYRTQYDILRSRQLATQVIFNLGLQNSELLNPSKPPGFFNRLWSDMTSMLARTRQAAPAAASTNLDVKSSVIDAYLSRLSIAPQMGTQLVVVGFSAPDARLSARIANAHVQAYIQRGIELNVESNRAVADYLQKNLAELKDRVQKSEAALNAYRRARGIVSFSVQNKSEIMMGRLAELNSDLTKAQNRRIELRTEYKLIESHNYDALPEVAQSSLIQQLREEVSVLSAKYASMLNRFNPGYHPLDDLKARLDQSRTLLDRQMQDTVEGIKGDYRAAIAQEADLTGEIDRIKEQALALKDDSIQDSVLSRDLESNQHLYENVLKRIQEIQVTATVQTSNVAVIDEAQPPRRPSSPQIVISLFLSGIIGLMFGLVTAFGLDYMDNSFKNKEEVVHYLRTPVLGVVPDFFRVARVGYGASRYYASRYISSQPQVAESPEDKSEPPRPTSQEIVVSGGYASLAAETYRMIRTAIMFSRAGGAPKTVLLTSALSNEGKTVTAVNTAIAFAQLGRRTVMIDADLRHGRVHEILDLEKAVGLSELLVGQADLPRCIRSTHIPDLYLIDAGMHPPNPADLLGSTRMAEILTALEADYDHIIIDSAPLIVSDSLSLSAMVDGVVVIVGANSPKQLVRDTCAQLRYVGARIFGVIMNRVESYPHYHKGSYYYRSDG